MRLVIGVLFLLLPLRPVLGAGVCLHSSATHQEKECSAPMQDVPHETDSSHHDSSQDCALMVVCATGSPVVFVVATQPFGNSPSAFPLYSNPSSLHQGDPLAPPQPPPIV